MAKRSRKVLTKHPRRSKSSSRKTMKRTKRTKRTKSSSRKTMKRTKRQSSRKHTSKNIRVERKILRNAKKNQKGSKVLFKKILNGGVNCIKTDDFPKPGCEMNSYAYLITGETHQTYVDHFLYNCNNHKIILSDAETYSYIGSGDNGSVWKVGNSYIIKLPLIHYSEQVNLSLKQLKDKINLFTKEEITRYDEIKKKNISLLNEKNIYIASTEIIKGKLICDNTDEGIDIDILQKQFIDGTVSTDMDTFLSNFNTTNQTNFDFSEGNIIKQPNGNYYIIDL
jgi:hypothetical protein